MADGCPRCGSDTCPGREDVLTCTTTSGGTAVDEARALLLASLGAGEPDVKAGVAAAIREATADARRLPWDTPACDILDGIADLLTGTDPSAPIERTT